MIDEAPGPRSVNPVASVAYIANLTTELRSLALADGYTMLGYLLGMAHAEASALRDQRPRRDHVPAQGDSSPLPGSIV